MKTRLTLAQMNQRKRSQSSSPSPRFKPGPNDIMRPPIGFAGNRPGGRKTDYPNWDWYPGRPGNQDEAGSTRPGMRSYWDNPPTQGQVTPSRVPQPTPPVVRTGAVPSLPNDPLNPTVTPGLLQPLNWQQLVLDAVARAQAARGF